MNNGGESRASTVTNEQRPLCHASPGRDHGGGQKTDGAGFEEIEENDTMSEGSFASAESHGYRTEEEETLTFEVSMIQLGWQNEELISDRWVKIADQPEVRVMQLTKRDEPLEREDEGCSKIGDSETKTKTVYCVTGLPISKQQELVEASFQLRARLLDMKNHANPQKYKKPFKSRISHATMCISGFHLHFCKSKLFRTKFHMRQCAPQRFNAIVARILV